MSEHNAGTAVADREVRPAPDAPPASRLRRWIRSPAALLTLAGVVLAAGLFVGGLALGRATTHSATPPGTTETTTSVGGGCVAGGARRCLAFTSAPTDTVRVNSRFSFRITTSSSTGTRIRKVGKLPKGVHFTNNHDGSATLAGTVVQARRHSVTGTYHLTVTAAIGSGKTRQVARQAFSLVVTS